MTDAEMARRVAALARELEGNLRDAYRSSYLRGGMARRGRAILEIRTPRLPKAALDVSPEEIARNPILQRSRERRH